MIKQLLTPISFNEYLEKSKTNVGESIPGFLQVNELVSYKDNTQYVKLLYI